MHNTNVYTAPSIVAFLQHHKAVQRFNLMSATRASKHQNAVQYDEYIVSIDTIQTHSVVISHVVDKLEGGGIAALHSQGQIQAQTLLLAKDRVKLPCMSRL